MTLLALLACAECPEGFEEIDDNCYPAAEEEEEVEVEGVPLEAPALLRRTSLDLLGVLPSEEDLRRVDEQPEALEELQLALLGDPRLEGRLVEVLGARWHTLVDDFDIQAREVGLEEYPYERSVGEEPLRLMARIGVEDRPWTDILRADFTMANESLESICPLEREGPGWSVAHYVDGRPPAGVLATNGFFWRYQTTRSNANRGRAAALARLLVCDDLSARPVTFEALTGSTGDALKESPVCISCHVTLEPMASSLFGWYWVEAHNPLEAGAYHPEREPMGEALLGVTGGWYGQPVDGLGPLGEAIAADPRFDRCQTSAFAEAFFRTDVRALEHYETLSGLTADWQDEGLRLIPLLGELVTHPLYAVAPIQPLAADQLASMVEDLTGFSWWSEGFDLMRSDTYGYRVMAGGVDGRFVLKAGQDPSLTYALVVKRLSEAAAAYAVEQGTFFTVAEVQTSPEDPAFAEQIDAWSWRLVAADGDVEGLAALWWAVEANAGAEEAWAAVISAVLRDQDLVMY